MKLVFVYPSSLAQPKLTKTIDIWNKWLLYHISTTPGAILVWLALDEGLKPHPALYAA
jgi:hypothetical protein